MSATVPTVITGLAVLTPLGDTIDALQASLRARRTAVERAAEGDWGEARIAGFKAERYVAVRGLRLYNRPTQLAICAAKLALADAECEQAIAGEDLGVVAASTYGHLETLFEYDRSLVMNGLTRTNPALMPVGIPSAPGAAVSLSFGAKACAVTLSDGGASSLDALGLAARLLAGGRARACLVVGAFTPCRELTLSALRAGLLAPHGAFHVLDRARRGTALGEAAAAVVLERAEDAVARGVRPRATVAAQFSAFAPQPRDLSGALARASDGALRLADIAAPELALVSAGANGSPAGDLSEAEALAAMLGGAPVPIMAIKGNLGESHDAAGMLQAVAAIAALRAGVAAPIAGLRDPAVRNLRLSTEEVPLRGRHALVTSTSSTGACSALVVTVGT